MAIIDGTGAWTDAQYAIDMHSSFCRQIGNQLGANPPPSKTDAQYERGPSFDGFRTRGLGEQAASYLKSSRQRDPNGKLYLAGYSRGASAAIMAAEILQKDQIKVEAMFLFDPVARHMSEGGEVIPGNVAKAWVARRKLDPDLVRAGERGGVLTAYLPFSNPMRPWFGETGTRAIAPCKLTEQWFRGSHGALGGVGWARLSSIDGPCQEKVRDWMNKAFVESGLPVTLLSFPP